MAFDIMIRQEDPRLQDIRQLLAASDAYSMALYPEEGRRPVDVEFLASPSVRFFVARLNGQPVGCVALATSDDGAVELKRMIVLPQTRGRGVGSSLLKRAEAAAAKEGVDTIRLETGPLNREAISLYRRHGYCSRGPFGTYEAGPHSVFFEKAVAGGRHVAPPGPGLRERVPQTMPAQRKPFAEDPE
jgi:putative acetyltransferase